MNMPFSRIFRIPKGFLLFIIFPITATQWMENNIIGPTCGGFPVEYGNLPEYPSVVTECNREPHYCRPLCIFSRLGMVNNHGSYMPARTKFLLQRMLPGRNADKACELSGAFQSCSASFNFNVHLSVYSGCSSYSRLLNCFRQSAIMICEGIRAQDLLREDATLGWPRTLIPPQVRGGTPSNVYGPPAVPSANSDTRVPYSYLPSSQSQPDNLRYPPQNRQVGPTQPQQPFNNFPAGQRYQQWNPAGSNVQGNQQVQNQPAQDYQQNQQSQLSYQGVQQNFPQRDGFQQAQQQLPAYSQHSFPQVPSQQNPQQIPGPQTSIGHSSNVQQSQIPSHLQVQQSPQAQPVQVQQSQQAQPQQVQQSQETPKEQPQPQLSQAPQSQQPQQAEQQQSQPQPAELQQIQPHPSELQQIQPHPAELQQIQPHPAELQQIQPHPSELQQIQPHPAELQQIQPHPAELQQIQPHPAELQQIQPHPAEQQQIQPNPAEQQPIQPHPAELQQIQPHPADLQQIQPHPAEQQQIQPHPAEMQQIQPQESPPPQEPPQQPPPQDIQSQHPADDNAAPQNAVEQPPPGEHGELTDPPADA